jgi:hypothetical protein
MQEGKIKQISDEPEEFFAKSYPVIFWTTSAKDAVDLYNNQFNDNFSL